MKKNSLNTTVKVDASTLIRSVMPKIQTAGSAANGPKTATPTR